MSIVAALMSRRVLAVAALSLLALAGGVTAIARQDPRPLAPVALPAGFQAEVFAENVDNARSMALGPRGTVFVGSQSVGEMHAVVDTNGDH